MTVTARRRRRRRSRGAGMEEKGGAPGLGFRLPEKLSAGRTHLFTRHRMRKVRDSSRWLIPLWISIWVLITGLIYLWMSYQADGKRRDSLASMCDERARVLQDQLNVSMNQLQALAILISTFHYSKTPSAIDQKTFARYVERTSFERPLTSGVAYGVRVRHADREQFERQQGWSIKKMDSSNSNTKSQGPGNAEAREPKEEYAPIIFAQDAYKHVISFDLLSGADDRDNVLRARESGKGVLSAPFKLLNNRLGVISTYAVYKYELSPNATPQECIQAAIGYLGGIFDIEALVDKLLHQLAGKQSIMVNVYDTTNERPIRMYGSNDTGSGMCQVSTLNFGDPTRKHEMHCRFIQSPPWPWVAIMTSIGTLVIGLLIGYIILATAKWIDRVEDDFQEMSVLKKRAKDADIAKSQFLNTVPHEIRTPVHGFLGMLEMLMDTDLDTTQQDYVETARTSGKVFLYLISEVLDQAKIESGKLELKAVPFDLRTVCDDILLIFCGKAQEKGLELAVFVSDQVPQTLIGDPCRIRQIITNLVRNSIKFTEKGHIYLTVRVVEEIMHCLEDETGAQYANTLSGYPVANRKRSWENFRLFSRELNFRPFAHVASDSISLIISVEDTGVGIPFYAQSRVFTPFMQVGPSIGGTGIGLSISKCLVSLMKGEIGFASKSQVGSTFTFTAVLTRAHSSGKENKSSKCKEINALVVDHRPVRAKVTKYHLQRLGVQTELTTDLDQYISKINCGSQIAKLVLIDKETWLKESYSMLLLVTKLRNKDQPDSTKLFVLENPKSSDRNNSHILREYNLNVIMKPLRASALQVSLERALGGTVKLHCRNLVVANSTLGSLLHNKRIIVVDDSIICLKVAAIVLKKYGAEVTCADSGTKAITLLKPPHNFDACFMDIQMPIMDGFEATKRIRLMERDLNEKIGRGEIPPEFASVRQWRIPILAMTADIFQATHEQCLKCEMDGYVSKPFEREKLYRECDRVFQTNKSPSSVELSYAVNRHDLVELEEDEIVDHLEEKAERKLTSVSVHSLPYRFYLNKKVVGVSLLGLMLYILVIGAFDLSLNQSLGIRREDEKMVLNKFGWSHGRLLMATLHGAWAQGGVENSDMISVDLRKMTGNNDSSGQQQQQHWYSHISSKYQEEATEMQNGTVKPHQPAHMSHKTTVGLCIALVSAIVLVLGIAVWLLLWCNRRKRVQEKELELSGGMGPRRFQLCELVAATGNFADENKLGQGGFGPVYRGYLRNQDCHVAIKVLSSQQQSEQGLREFHAEVKVMTQLRHRNIVNLVGWCECDSQQRLLLVYELMAQGSLDKHLYDPEEILTWQQRYKIALDLGNALLYLHRDCEKCIVHGDIKPANVMLDASYNAKLGDFGLARFIEHGEEPQTTQVIAGTPGYIDPEFIANRWPRAASDVYSFGVVLLETSCGKRPASRQPNGASSLLAWVIRLYDQGMILDAADQKLNGEFNRQQMERVLVTGLWCAHRDPIQRPSIEQAMDVLRSADAELPVLRAVHDERHIRAMEEQAYGDLPIEDHSVDALTTSTYFTSKDSAYLLAQE